jgi:hypothetical protein
MLGVEIAGADRGEEKCSATIAQPLVTDDRTAMIDGAEVTIMPGGRFWSQAIGGRQHSHARRSGRVAVG